LSIFEIIMLICFGAAWPFSIAKSFKSRQTGGKSLMFLLVVLVGYGMGILHKAYYHYDVVIGLYAFNGLMVCADILLFFRNKRLEKRETAPATAEAAA